MEEKGIPPFVMAFAVMIALLRFPPCWAASAPPAPPEPAARIDDRPLHGPASPAAAARLRRGSFPRRSRRTRLSAVSTRDRDAQPGVGEQRRLVVDLARHACAPPPLKAIRQPAGRAADPQRCSGDDAAQQPHRVAAVPPGRAGRCAGRSAPGRRPSPSSRPRRDTGRNAPSAPAGRARSARSVRPARGSRRPRRCRSAGPSGPAARAPRLAARGRARPGAAGRRRAASP